MTISLLPDYTDLLDALGIEVGDLLFVHGSTDWLGVDVVSAFQLVQVLLTRLGPEGTLLMPTYIWWGSTARPAEGTVLDVRRTPSKVGLLSEIFRRMPGTYRSEHYWAPVAGQGKLVKTLLTNQSTIVHPFGPGSTFTRLLDYDTKIVGLGVSLNTSSPAHLPDYELEAEYPCKVFSDHPIRGQIIDYEGHLIVTESIIVRSEVIQNYNPSRLFETSPLLQQSLRRADHGKSIRFSYPLWTYYQEAIRLGREALARQAMTPWLDVKEQST